MTADWPVRSRYPVPAGVGPLLRRTQAERDAALAEVERLREELRLLRAAERAACAAVDALVGDP